MEELKATQEEAARRENELSGILDAINQFLIQAEMDLSGRLIKTNQQFLETFGYNDHQVKEKFMKEFVDEQDRELFLNVLDQAGRGKEIQQKIRFQNNQGETLWLIASFSAVKNKDGEAGKLIFIALDHTDSEKEKQELLNKLDQNN